MTIPEDNLEGFFHFKMDPKCRVAVPAEWSPNPKAVLRLYQTESHGIPVLKVLSEREVAKIVRDIEGRPGWTPADIKDVKGHFFENCMKASTNLQNKLLIPRAWCEPPEITPGEMVVLVGRGSFFEILSPDNFEARRKAQSEALKERLKEIGI